MATFTAPEQRNHMEKTETKEESTSRYAAIADKDDAEINDNYGELMELEHMIGISTYFHQCFVPHPQQSNLYLHALGNILVISDFTDPHNQSFLRGHDMPISSISISSDGNFIASGQYGNPSMKNSSVVNLWDYNKQMLLHTFEGLTERVNNLLFTNDLKFLIATDTSGLFVVWDIYNFETITAKRVNNNYPKGQQTHSQLNSLSTINQGQHAANINCSQLSHKPSSTQAQSAIHNPNQPCYISDLKLVSIQSVPHSVHNIYTLLLAYDHKVYQWQIRFSVQHMEYIISEPISFHYPPNSNLKRNLTLMALNKNQTVLCVGNDVGEMFVFKVQAQSFNNLFQACSQGVNALMFDENDNILVAGGDGSIAEFKLNQYLQAQQTLSIKLDAPVTMLESITHLNQNNGNNSNSNSNQQTRRLLAATNLGKLYEIHRNTQSYVPILEGHNQSIKQVAFGTHNHIFASVTECGVLTLWDLSNYSIIAQNKHANETSCLRFFSDDNIVIGLNDGSIVSWKLSDNNNVNINRSSQNEKVYKKRLEIDWRMSNAHRGKVTSIALRESKTLIFTGGDDGIFRIWNYQHRTIVGQFHLMIGEIMSIMADNVKKEVFHILGSERQLVSFNMKRDNVTIRRMIQSKHSDYNMTYMSLTQSNINEKEMYCVTNNGHVIIWDPEINDMIVQFNVADCLLNAGHNSYSNYSFNLTCCALSHSSKYLCVGSTIGQIIVLNVSNYSKNKIDIIGNYHYHGAAVSSCSWTPDDKQIVSSAKDGAICVWNLYC